MKISELSALLGVPVYSLRRWENYLDVNIPRDEHGDRFYSPAWVEYFKQVKALIDRGANFEQVKKELVPPFGDEPEPPSDELEQLREALKGLSGKVLGLTVDLDSVDEEVSGLTGDVTGIKSQLSGLTEELTVLQNRQNDTERAVSEIKRVVDELKERPGSGGKLNVMMMVLMVIGLLIGIGLISMAFNQ